jgi:stage II sporulation protein AB (anti-sigma F factor)
VIEVEKGPGNTVKLEFPSRPENVGFARTAVAVFASQKDFTLDQIDEIKVAVSEAVSNAVIHGYKETSGVVRVEAELDDGGLTITVGDEGPGISDIDWAMEPGRTTEPGRMGLGLVFIKAYMDEATLFSAPGAGTRVRMRKNLTPSENE